MVLLKDTMPLLTVRVGWKNKIRNSNFKSSLLEGLLLAEFYPTTFFEYDASDNYKTLRPYVVAGIGFFKFNPKGLDPQTGNWVELQPLRTEGQGMPQYPERKEYNLTQINVPMGVCLKYQFSETMTLSLEIIHL